MRTTEAKYQFELLSIRSSSFQIWGRDQFYTSTRPLFVHSLQDRVGVIRSLWIQCSFQDRVGFIGSLWM